MQCMQKEERVEEWKVERVRIILETGINGREVHAWGIWNNGGRKGRGEVSNGKKSDGIYIS